MSHGELLSLDLSLFIGWERQVASSRFFPIFVSPFVSAALIFESDTLCLSKVPADLSTTGYSTSGWNTHSTKVLRTLSMDVILYILSATHLLKQLNLAFREQRAPFVGQKERRPEKPSTPFWSQSPFWEGQEGHQPKNWQERWTSAQKKTKTMFPFYVPSGGSPGTLAETLC